MVSKRRSLRRAVPAFGLVLIASLALTGIASGTASAATQHWLSCINIGEKGMYKDAGCTEVGTKGSPHPYSWSHLLSTSYTMKSNTNFIMSFFIQGISLEISCSQESGGIVANPSGGGAGTITASSFKLSGCTVLKPAKNTCVVENGQVIFGAFGEATEFEGKPAVRFVPAGGAWSFGGLSLGDGSSSCGLRGRYEIRGSFTGVVNSATASLDFTKASSELNIGMSYLGTLVGTSKLELATGEAWKIAP